MLALQALAKEINEFNLGSEKSKDEKVYREGKRMYNNIRLHAKFIIPSYLFQVEQFLNENGKLVYKRYFKSYFEELSDVKEKKK